MPKTVEEVAEEVRMALGDSLCPGLRVWTVADPLRGYSILIGNDDLVFSISQNEIDDNLAVDRAVKDMPFLRVALAQHYTVRAANFNRAVMMSVARQLDEQFEGQHASIPIGEIGNATVVLN